MSQGNSLYPQPGNAGQSMSWQGHSSPNIPPAQSPVSSAYNPQYSQSTYVTSGPTYAYSSVGQAYNSYGPPAKQGKKAAAIFAAILSICAALLAALATALPFLVRRNHLSLIEANVGAGLSVIFVGIVSAVLIGVGAFGAKSSRIVPLLGGLGGIFLIVFTLANLFGADANRIVSMGGTRGAGGFIIIGAGLAMIIAAFLATMAVSSKETVSPQYPQPQYSQTPYQQPQYAQPQQAQYQQQF